MSSRYEERIAALSGSVYKGVLSGGQRGVEKESLRITPAGIIAQTPHPRELGSALTHRFITTDYSEALLEFVTPPQQHSWATQQFMCDIHGVAYAALGDELLWPFSMPCELIDEQGIPLAQYGSSNVGRMKTIYREGLGHRYGRFMQVISGIHFNYSVPEKFWEAWSELEESDLDAAALRSSAYMGLVRNVRRLDWLLLYLFGASPAVSSSFLAGKSTQLKQHGAATLYSPTATSLRMSDIGYQNNNQAAVYVSANSLDEYVRDLSAAVATPNPDFVAMGIKRDGEYLQLNANQLQIENEYYSTIRPKRVAYSGERPTAALSRAGVEYIELRVLDISPFDPIGLSQAQQKFLEAFLIYALLLDSPDISESQQDEFRSNQLLVARSGREQGLRLQRDGEQVGLQSWAQEICAQMRPVCELLDAADGKDSEYSEALDCQLAAINDPELTPSARLLRELEETGQEFAEYGLETAQCYREYFSELGSDINQHVEMFAQEAQDSLVRQEEIETTDSISLDNYIQHYNS